MSHPRDVHVLERTTDQDAAFLDSLARGRLHHAWLLTGPEGVGKAGWAYRAARRLLGARSDGLDSDPGDPVSRLVASQSHPDLMVLERETTSEGRLKRDIPVDAARQLPDFFARTPAMAPFRVAIIDCADDLNTNSANALLKTLEEPPPRGVLLLVSHAPGGLLATIRSRCRRLAFPPWAEEEVARFVHARTGVAQDVAHRAAALSAGAPGRALAALSDGGLEFDAAAEDLVSGLPYVDEAGLAALADRFRGQDGMARFLNYFDRLGGHLQKRAEASPPREAARWSQAWSECGQHAADAAALNLDRADVLWTTVASLKRVATA
jgi:DNA polymerase-3 subunit delta'